MANIKMFGLVGVGSDVQFGKGGPRLIRSTNLFAFRQSDGTTATRIKIATPTDNDDATTKLYVDNLSSGVQTELDTTQTGAGLNTNGSYPTITGTNYLNSSTSLRNADALLDAAIASIQTEVNTTQTGAGLTSTGAYPTITGTNYLNSSTSIINANSLLDTAIFNLQTEVNTTQTGAGLTSTGAYPTITGTNYLNSSTSIINANSLLDTAIFNLQTEVNTTQTGAGLNTNGSYPTITGTNYLNSSTSLRNADALLDTAIFTVSGTVTSIDGRLTTVEGAYINRNGSVAFTGNQSLGGFRITNLGTPTASTDAVTKAYVDSAVSGLGSVFNYVGTVAGGASVGTPTDLSALAQRDPGDYYRVATAGWFIFTGGTAFFANLNDGLIKNTTANDWDKIDNSDSTVAGTANRITVTGSVDTGYTLDISSTYVGQTSITTLGTIGTGTWSATTIATDRGGTGQTTYATGDLLIGSGTTLAKLARGTARQVLRVNTAGTNLEYASLVAADVGVSNVNWVGTDLNTVLTEIDTRADNIQSELDTSQTAIGLNTNGTFQTFTGTNYLNSATTIRNSLTALDTQLFTTTNSAAAIQSELDTSQTAIGLNTNGTFQTFTGTNYLNSATTIRNSLTALDTQLLAATNSAAALKNEIASPDTRTTVRVQDTGGIEFFDEVSATKTKVGGIIGGNSTNTSFEIDLTTAGEVRFEALGTNPNLRLFPAGTGRVIIGSAAAGTVQADTGQNLVLRGGDNGAGAGGNIVLRAGDGSTTDGVISLQQGNGGEIFRVTSGSGSTNLLTTTIADSGITFGATSGNLILAPGAGGTISASSARVINVATPTAGTDATNKTYVDGLLATRLESRQVALTEVNGTVNIGSVITGEVARVTVTITTPFTTGAAITVGRVGALSELVTAAQIDESTTGAYVNDCMQTYGSSTQLVAVVTAGSGSTGVAKVLVEYARA